MQAREAAKASAHALVERFEALELGRRRGAPHVVDHSAVAAAGTKEAEGNLRVIQCTDGVQEFEGRGCTLLRVAAMKAASPTAAPRSSKLACTRL